MKTLTEVKEYLFRRYSEIQSLQQEKEKGGNYVGALTNKVRAQTIAEIYSQIFNEDIA